jgi:hypothetical protein
VLRRCHQHRRSRDRLPQSVYGRAARRHRCGRGGFAGAPGLGDLGKEVGEAEARRPHLDGKGGRDGLTTDGRDEGGDR